MFSRLSEYARAGFNVTTVLDIGANPSAGSCPQTVPYSHLLLLHFPMRQRRLLWLFAAPKALSLSGATLPHITELSYIGDREMAFGDGLWDVPFGAMAFVPITRHAAT